MKLAIDSYSYHRYFGEIYPGLQKKPETTMSIWDFLKRAQKHGVEGVSLESCYFPSIDGDLISKLREKLDSYGFERAWAWGHPNGLRSGTDQEAARDLARHIGYAGQIGARVMRIVGGSRRSRPESWTLHKRRLGGMLKKLVDVAEEHCITLAIENHIDMLADEMLDLLHTVHSKWLGVCLDTGNNLRMHEDPVLVAKKLAPWTRATHIKDLGILPGDPREFSSWPSVPLGEGLVKLDRIIGYLTKAKYDGLLAIELDFLHPNYGTEDQAVAQSVKYLRTLMKR